VRKRVKLKEEMERNKFERKKETNKVERKRGGVFNSCYSRDNAFEAMDKAPSFVIFPPINPDA
jgi:hypothetical protein